MYLNHFGLSESPFRITPHTEFFFSGANRGATLEALLYAITSDEGIVKVTGEVGSGKTMLCRVLIERLPPEVETVYLANPSLEKEEILQAILDDLKFSSAGEYRSNQLLRALQDHLISLYGAGKKVVLLIDEAHAMPPETLEQIRLLSNLESNRHKLLQIALFGQQELDDHLGTTLLRPLRERITHSFRLEPLVHADVGQYLMFRLRQAGYKGPDLFNRDALKLIAKASEGLTRRLNILADKSLLAAFTEGEHGITAKHARAAIRDSGFAPLSPGRSSMFHRQRWPSLLAFAGLALIAVGVATGVGTFYWLQHGNPIEKTGSADTKAPVATASVTPQAPPLAPKAVPPGVDAPPVVAPISAATASPVVVAPPQPPAVPAIQPKVISNQTATAAPATAPREANPVNPTPTTARTVVPSPESIPSKPTLQVAADPSAVPSRKAEDTAPKTTQTAASTAKPASKPPAMSTANRNTAAKPAAPAERGSIQTTLPVVEPSVEPRVPSRDD